MKCANVLSVGCLLLGSVVAPARADEASAVAALKAKGIVKVGIYLNVADEAEFAKKLRDEIKFKKALTMTAQTFQMANAQNEQNEQAITVLNQQLIIANQNGDVGANNQIIAQLKIRDQMSEKTVQAEREARGKANAARDDYLSFVLDVRKLADKIDQQYQVLPTDPDVQKAIADLNEATKKTYALAPSKAHETLLKNLKRIEDSVLSDDIQLVKGPHGTFDCSVTVNEKYKVSMAVDSGASCILLPDRMLKELSVEVPADAPTVQFKIADGSLIDGKLIQLKSVRVGRFEVKDVECGVFGPQYTGVDPLLGMSFLGKFNFKIDPDAGKLSMTRIEEPAKGPTRPAAGAK